MAQLFFKYGTMNSGKSIELLKTAHNYREQGKEVIIMTSALDTRDGVGTVASRIGLSEDAIAINADDNLVNVVYKNAQDKDKLSCVLVDEAQFLSKSNVHDLCRIVDYYNMPVICYGLKTDFRGELFEGSEALLKYADKLEEIKTVCANPTCQRKATMNARLVDGKQVTNGEQVVIGDEEYTSLCRFHWKLGRLKTAVMSDVDNKNTPVEEIVDRIGKASSK